MPLALRRATEALVILMTCRSDMATKSKAWTLDRVRERCIEEGACWIWQQGTNGSGYPQACIDGAPRLVPAWVLAKVLGRPVAPKHVATTKCLNRLCCSPYCVIEMSRSDRIRKAYQLGERDRIAEGRARRESVADRGWVVRLNAEKAREIRQRISEPTRLLAQEYGVSQDHIRRVMLNQSWPEIASGASVFNWRPA